MAIPDFAPFIGKLLRQSCELLSADAGSIFLRDGEVLRVVATTGLFHPASGAPITDVSGVTYKRGEGLTGWVFQHKKPLLIKTFQQSTGQPFIVPDDLEEKASAIESYLAVPITADDQVAGVIRLSKRRSGNVGFTEHDQKLLEVYAQTAGAAIEANVQLRLVTNAPYAFVLMPFSSEFRDVYELGVRETTRQLQMRCERVDDIQFNDAILQEIYKNIQSADVVIAEMTGRNPNVFYEVGYAHALSKDVVLLTQDAKDIPFDLKGHNHIVYNGQITTLRKKLQKRLSAWVEQWYAARTSEPAS